MVVPGGGLDSNIMVPWTTKPGEMTPQERANDKSKHRQVGSGLGADFVKILARSGGVKIDMMAGNRN